MNFKIHKKGKNFKTESITKADGVTIAAGSFVALSSGLAITAVAGSTDIAWAPNGAASSDLNIEVTVGDDFQLMGTADANFAVTDKGIECDITAAQLIDLGASATNVLKVSSAEDAGTVGATTDVIVKINKPLI